MKEHPFVQVLGGVRDRDCQWCPLPKANRVHLVEPTEWEDANHALIVGAVASAITIGISQRPEDERIVKEVTLVLDENGDFTNIARVTTRSGRQYDVTVTPTQ